jgi:hypothetical protein
MKTENQSTAGAAGVPGAPTGSKEPSATVGRPPASNERPPTTNEQPPATASTPNKNAGVRGAFLWSLRQMGLSIAWFAGILVLVVLFIGIVLSIFGEPSETSFRALIELPWASGLSSYFTGYAAAFITAGPIFFLVMGIVMPTYLETLLNFGLTRRQYALGLLLAATLTIGGIGLVDTFAVLVINQFVLSQDLGFLTLLLCNYLFFLTGWFIVAGYLRRRVISCFLTTALGVEIVSVGLSWHSILLESPLASNGTVNLGLFVITPENASIVGLVSTLVLIAILIPTVIALTRRAPIKV